MANTIGKVGEGGAMNELQMQATYSQWFWNTFPAERGMLHNNDNNSYNSIEGARKKAIGVVKGVSDFELILDGHVIFIEFKLPGQKQKPEQEDFERKVTERGHIYIIFYSFVEARDFTLNLYL